jgi:hypothetical protein
VNRYKEEEEEEEEKKKLEKVRIEIVSFVCLYSYQFVLLCTVYCSHCYKMKSSADELNEVSRQTEFQHITTHMIST